MMNISLAGLFGAIAGTVVAAVVYHVFIGALDRQMRKRTGPASPEQHAGFELTLSLLRRLVLAIDLLVFAAAGYWIARTLAD